MSLENQIKDDKLIPIEDELKCLWKTTYEDNQRGLGTTFEIDADIPCKYCSGYEFDKPCYTPTDEVIE